MMKDFFEELSELCGKYRDDGKPMTGGMGEELALQFVGALGDLAKRHFKRELERERLDDAKGGKDKANSSS